MNSTSIIEQKIAEGKAKFGVCEISTCSNDELLYKVADTFICWNCMDRLYLAMKDKGMIVND